MVAEVRYVNPLSRIGIFTDLVYIFRLCSLSSSPGGKLFSLLPPRKSMSQDTKATSSSCSVHIISVFNSVDVDRSFVQFN